MAYFANRSRAGRVLAQKLAAYAGRKNVVVLGLPRGGVPVAFEVAKSLGAPLDVFVVRKLGAPGQEELAMGAIASGGIRVLNPDVVGPLRIPQQVIERAASREQEELERRERVYRGDLPPVKLENRRVIVVDDGLATGASMLAAVRAIKQKKPTELVVAVPIAPPGTCREFEKEVDQIFCARTPAPFFSVGSWYEDFSQTSDEEVRELLAMAANG